MKFIQNESRDLTTFLEKTEYPLDLLVEPKNLDYDSMLECQKDSVHSGINLEQPIYNVTDSIHMFVKHKNTFNNVKTYCSERGIDIVSIDKQNVTWLNEITNPKDTTSLGIDAWLEKLIRFLKEDPKHEGNWVITISHVNAKTIPFVIKCLMFKIGIRLIDLKCRATNHNCEMIMAIFRARLSSGYNYFASNTKITSKVSKVLNNITYTKFKYLSKVEQKVSNIVNKIYSNTDNISKESNIINKINKSRKSLHVPYSYNTALPLCLRDSTFYFRSKSLLLIKKSPLFFTHIDLFQQFSVPTLCLLPVKKLADVFCITAKIKQD